MWDIVSVSRRTLRDLAHPNPWLFDAPFPSLVLVHAHRKYVPGRVLVVVSDLQKVVYILGDFSSRTGKNLTVVCAPVHPSSKIGRRVDLLRECVLGQDSSRKDKL